jgi:hypothetical protein
MLVGRQRATFLNLYVGKMQDSKLFLVPPTIALPGSPSAMPPAWPESVESQLLEEEQVLAWLQTDLDSQLYSTGFVVAATNGYWLPRKGKGSGRNGFTVRLSLVRSITQA